MCRGISLGLVAALANPVAVWAADFPVYLCTSTETTIVAFDGAAWTETKADAARAYELNGGEEGWYSVRNVNYLGSEFRCIREFVDNLDCYAFEGNQAFHLNIGYLAFARVDASGTLEQETGLTALIETGYCVVLSSDTDE